MDVSGDKEDIYRRCLLATIRIFNETESPRAAKIRAMSRAGGREGGVCPWRRRREEGDAKGLQMLRHPPAISQDPLRWSNAPFPSPLQLAPSCLYSKLPCSPSLLTQTTPLPQTRGGKLPRSALPPPRRPHAPEVIANSGGHDGRAACCKAPPGWEQGR
jgi:hypothetical protein